MYLSSLSKEYLGEDKVDGISRRIRRFNPRPIYVGFLVKKVALGQISLRVRRLFPATIIPSILHTYLFTNLLPTPYNRNH